MLYNILVVDDDKRSAEGLASMIGVLGHTVGIAYGPRMAMQQLNEVIPDIIFLDVNMPGINGIEVLRYLRRDPYTAQVPVVIVSANDTESEKQVAYDSGANEYIIKPPMIEDIEAVLEKLLGKPAEPGLAQNSNDGDRPTTPAPPTKKPPAATHKPSAPAGSKKKKTGA